MKNEFIRKEFKLRQDTISKIDKLKMIKEEENPSIKIYEKDIIIEAIDLYYSSKFGKDVFDHTIGKLENVLGNMMQKVLNEYSLALASGIESVHFQTELMNEMLLLILKANNVLPEEQMSINSLIMLNEEIEDKLKSAVLLKREMSR